MTYEEYLTSEQIPFGDHSSGTAFGMTSAFPPLSCDQFNGRRAFRPRVPVVAKGESVLRLLERSIRSVDQRLILLAPPEMSISPVFENVAMDVERHQKLVQDIQRLRGSIYLNDGAV